MTRRTLLGTLAAPLLAAGKTKPNVLFILADEWRAQAFQSQGDTNVETPAINKLEAQSVRFSHAISGTPVCCPFRASLLTGQYPLTHGVFVNDVELKPKGETLGESFQKAGYKTGFIGKWHVYGSPDGKYGRRLAPIPKEKRFGFEYWKACECTHDYNHSLYYEGDETTPKYWMGYDAYAQTEDACGFIAARAEAKQPFCLVLSLGPPHFPLNSAPPELRERYKNREMTLRPNVPAELKEEAIADLRGYYAHMAAVDQCVDQLLSTLDRSGIAEDTIVVFTSDHGDMMSSQGLTRKLFPWEESIRVPFFVRYPRKLGTDGRHLTLPLNSPDIYPTLLGLADLPVPNSVEGVDYSGAMQGKGKLTSGRGALISLPVPTTEARKHGFAEYRGIRTERYTYVRSIHGPWLLYDNETDPYQMHNLVGKPEVKALQAKLDSELNVELKHRGDAFLPASEYIRRAGVGHYAEVTVKAGKMISPWGDWQSTMQ